VVREGKGYGNLLRGEKVRYLAKRGTWAKHYLQEERCGGFKKGNPEQCQPVKPLGGNGKTIGKKCDTTTDNST